MYLTDPFTGCTLTFGVETSYSSPSRFPSSRILRHLSSTDATEPDATVRVMHFQQAHRAVVRDSLAAEIADAPLYY